MSFKRKVPGKPPEERRSHDRVAWQLEFLDQFSWEVFHPDVIGRECVVPGDPVVLGYQNVRDRDSFFCVLACLFFQVAVERR